MSHSKKFLFVSKDSLSGDLALELIKEGHKVKFYFQDKYSQDVYDGFFDKVEDWKKYVDWADIVIFDDENFGRFADKLRRKNKLVIGGSIYTDKLEIDRKFGQKELRKNGVSILPSWHFTNYDKAINFIRRRRGRYVFKPSGAKQSGNKNLIIISQENDGDDLLEFLRQNKKILRKKSPKFILQEFADGIEIAVGAFFNGNDFVYPINVNFEYKRFFHGDLGPLTGETGTLMYWSAPNKIFQDTLQKMLIPLRKSKYVGYLDINCIVNGKGIFPLEFTSRFGYPTIQIQLEGIKTKTGELLYNLAKRKKFDFKTKEGFQIGVVIFTPPALSEGDDDETAELYRGLAINFKNHHKLLGIHIGDVKNDEGVWRIAGCSGWNLVVTGSGSTVSKARHIAYNRIRNIRIPNMFYRNDVGKHWNFMRRKLTRWGYI